MAGIASVRDCEAQAVPMLGRLLGRGTALRSPAARPAGRIPRWRPVAAARHRPPWPRGGTARRRDTPVRAAGHAASGWHAVGAARAGSRAVRPRGTRREPARGVGAGWIAAGLARTPAAWWGRGATPHNRCSSFPSLQDALPRRRSPISTTPGGAGCQSFWAEWDARQLATAASAAARVAGSAGSSQRRRASGRNQVSCRRI